MKVGAFMAKEIQIKGFICEKCGKVYSYLDSATNERMANNCCMQYHCQDCGLETPKYQTLCDKCENIRNFNKAKKISYIDYIKKFPDNMLYCTETNEYYSELEELVDDLLYNNIPVPDFVWGTDKYRVEVDAEYALSLAEEDSGLEDFQFDPQGVEEFLEFVAKWNKEYGTNAYMVSFKIAIVLTEQEKRGTN